VTGSKLTDGAAYMRLIDRGTVSDQLVSATSPVAQKVVENGVYGMCPDQGIGVGPGAVSTVLEPGGAHVIFEGLKQPLNAGETFPLTLSLKNAGQFARRGTSREPASGNTQCFGLASVDLSR
jgi:copper(I)-binding protein